MSFRCARALFLITTLLFTSCGAVGAGRAVDAPVISEDVQSSQQNSPQTVELTFSASGDNLIHDGIYQQAYARTGGNGYDFSYCYNNVKEFYAKQDINWVNQETLVNSVLPPSTYPCFSTPAQMGHTLYDLGFRIFNLSNNHTYDQGSAGLQATCEFWDSMPKDVVTCGLYRSSGTPGLALQNVQGVTIAYLGYTEHTNGLPTPQNSSAHVTYTNELDKMKQEIQSAAHSADLVVVSNHWGVEGSHIVTDAQKALAQQQADWGADLIIGTGPHVVQSAEWLTSSDGHTAFVSYSLGNFISAQSDADTMIGAVLSCTIRQTILPDGNKSTEIVNPQLHPIITHYDANYSNIRLYWFADYTDQLAAQHGVQSRMPEFSMNYIMKILQNSISDEFLAL